MALTNIEKSVLRTLAYYHALGVGRMSVSEIKKYFFESKDALFFDIYTALSVLEGHGLVNKDCGLWALSNSGTSAEARIDKIKQAALKWKSFKKEGVFLAYIPYTRTISVTGSMALLNSTKHSDIDILIENKKDRIWTTRFLVTIISFVLGRRKRAANRAGKLCFSQHISENAPAFGPPGIATVVDSIRIIVWEDKKGKKFKNKALLYFNPAKIPFFLKGAIEFLFDTTGLGVLIERILAKVQIIKIKNNPTEYPRQLTPPTPASKNLIFYYPKVKATEKKYKKILSKLTI